MKIMKYCIRNKNKFYNIKKRKFISEANIDCIISSKRIANYIFKSLQSLEDTILNELTDEDLKNMGLNIEIFEKPSYFLGIEYKDYKPNTTYKGVFIDRYLKGHSKQIISVNTGDAKADEELALEKLYDIAGEVSVTYQSSYDDYFMDFKYENDPEYRKQCDEELVKINNDLSKNN
jgi:hypothetical protein